MLNMDDWLAFFPQGQHRAEGGRKEAVTSSLLSLFMKDLLYVFNQDKIQSHKVDWWKRGGVGVWDFGHPDVIF